MYKHIMTLTALGAALVIGTVPAEAQRTRGHSVSIQGSNGRGAIQSRSIARQPGAASATRSIQTNGGRGATTTRDASWSDGTYSSNRATTTNSGKTFGRSTTATNNGDGTASFSSTGTGPNGQSSTVSGTVTRQP
jgi:hypothetical protein